MQTIEDVNNYLYNLADNEWEELEENPDILYNIFPDLVAIEDYDLFINQETDRVIYEDDEDEEAASWLRPWVCDQYKIADFQVNDLHLIFEAR